MEEINKLSLERNQNLLKNKINSLNFETLKDVWVYTENSITNEETYYIRSAIMDRLEAINQSLFLKWLDGVNPTKDLEMFKDLINSRF